MKTFFLLVVSLLLAAILALGLVDIFEGQDRLIRFMGGCLVLYSLFRFRTLVHIIENDKDTFS